MQTTQGSMLQSLRAVQKFLDDNAVQLASVVQTGTRKELDDAIALLSSHAATQSGSFLAAKGATQKQGALRTALLRDHMAPIARIAAHSDLPGIPEIEPLRMPRGRPTTEKLSAAAYGMAQAVTPFATTFVAAGLPADFIALLTGAADALVGSLGERTQNRGKQGGATKGLKEKLSAGRKIVHTLDAFVKSALKDDPALLANWNMVKRVQKGGGRPATPVTTPVAPTPATTPSTPPSPATPPLA